MALLLISAPLLAQQARSAPNNGPPNEREAIQPLDLMDGNGIHNNDWPAYNRDLQGDRFSPLQEINLTNVSLLAPACTYDTGENTSFEGSPVAAGGIIYVTTHNTTYAIDGATCQLKWKHAREAPHNRLNVNRGAVYYQGQVFRGSTDAHIYAMDAETGRQLWDTPIGDPARGETTPLAPIAWNGMVYAGIAGGDVFGVTGRIYGLDAKSGQIAWRFDVVPESGPARATWPKASPENPPTGGATWSSYALDTQRGILFVSTGNPAPDFQNELHPGDSLYASSILAIDARSGKLLGYVQPIKHDYHDWDISSAPAVIQTRAGKNLVTAAAKDGFLYAIARDETATGQPVEMKVAYQTPTTTRSNTEAPLSAEHETRFCPGTLGGAEWNGPAYSPQLNALFVGAIDWCTAVKMARPDQLKGERAKTWSGGDPENPFGRKDPVSQWGGWVSSIDADTGRVLWKYHSPTPILAGVTATAAGLVFTGDLNGDAIALDAASGKVLWRNSTHEPIGGGVISYAAGGHQHIAVAAGMNGPLWPVKSDSARIVVYGLK